MKNKILIVDDDLAIVEVIKIILEERNYKVLTITDGAKVKQTIQHYLPDLILLDFWLPGLDGKKIASQIKNMKDAEGVPIIMISAHDSPGKIAKEVGADDFLAKPFDIDELTRIIRKYLAPENKSSHAYL